MHNPKFNIDREKADQLLVLWKVAEPQIEHSRNVVILQQLRRECPVLTKRQICFVAANLGKTDGVIIPEWLLELLDTARNVSQINNQFKGKNHA